ncbi:MAG: DUF4352 domain-containing protein [Bacilli bacterium]|nr:DUF4352 domain-containing protein [Bacilli bacterium]
MKNIKKSIILTSSLFLLSGCALPFQSNKYPAWTTKGLLESYTLVDGRTVDGWMGLEVGTKVSAKWYDFTVNNIEELSEYSNYKASNDKKLIHATITITNTSDKDVYIFDGDFALVWNLDSEERKYVTSMDAFTDTMLKNETVIKVGETKTIDTVYEIDKNIEKPMAIYYYEQYSDGQKGNKYYIYIK